MQLLNDDTFSATTQRSNQTVLVLFETDWSGYCQILLMILKKLETTFAKQIRFYNMDFEMNRNTATQFNIGRVPTILIFRNGELIERITGIQSQNDMAARLKKLVENPYYPDSESLSMK
ncbi:thioredoxin family protein [bacterium]|nr:thioredoxin family protein [bacterium]